MNIQAGQWVRPPITDYPDAKYRSPNRIHLVYQVLGNYWYSACELGETVFRGGEMSSDATERCRNCVRSRKAREVA